MSLYQWWRRWRDSKDVETRLDALRMLLHLSRNEPIKAPILEFKRPTGPHRSVRHNSRRMEW